MNYNKERTVVTTFGSVCSGIESVSVAVHPLGWTADWFAEIEPFPSAVLAHRFPEVPNHGDMTALPAMVLRGEIEAPEVLVGGTPCQAFSVAGMRQGLTDPRGALTIKFVELADAIDHVRSADGREECVVWWENVPGVLSDKGNAFGCFLAALVGESEPLQPSGGRWTDAGCVYGPERAAAWRVLDAQYFGLAQRRRRVFVVASARRGFDPASVLFESEGVRRDTPPSREKGEEVATGADGRAPERRWPADVASTLDTTFGTKQGLEDQHVNAGCPLFVPVYAVHGTQDPDVRIDQAHTLGRNHGQENAVLSVSLRGREGGATAELGDDVSGCLRASSGGGDKPHVLAPVAFVQNSRDEVRLMGGDGQIVGALAAEAGMKQQCYVACREVAQTITSNYGKQVDNSDTALGPNVVASRTAVRRLTPLECERLMGFPDNWTQIPWRNKPADECPDGPRYKAIGNSKAVPVVRWIARRIESAL